MAVAAVVAALALAGTAAASLSPSQYRTHATAVCKDTAKKLGGVKKPQSKKDIGRFLEDSLPIFKGQYDKLKKLDPPKALRFLHGKAVKLEKQQIDGIQDLIDEINAGKDPLKTFTKFEKTLDPLSKAENDAWRKLRVPACEL